VKSLETARNVVERGEGRERIREEIQKRFGTLDGALFSRLDSNGDGALERSEVPEKSRSKAFQWFDHDDDGRISRDEIEAILGRRPPAEPTGDPVAETGDDARLRSEVIRQLRESDGALFKQLDKNRDGHLIRSEIPERFRGKIFDRFDVDGDGHVSPQEWEAVQSAAKQERD